MNSCIKVFLLSFVFFLTLLKCSGENIEILSQDFSDNSLGIWEIQAIKDGITITNDPKNKNKRVMKAHISIREDYSNLLNKTPRAEIFNDKIMLQNGSKYLIKFKTYLPKDFKIEMKDYNQHIFFQVHQNLLEGSPQLSIDIDKDEYKMVSDSAFSFSEHKQVCKELGKATPDIGKWTDWIVFYEPSYTAEGRIVIWKNNELILDYRGVCAYKDTPGYVKFGLYKWNWQKKPSTVEDIVTYFSDIQVDKL